jgi:hypothetical protein
VFTKFAFGDADVYNETSFTYNNENYFDMALGLGLLVESGLIEKDLL